MEEIRILRENPSQISQKDAPNYLQNMRKIEQSPKDRLISALIEKLCENRWSWIYLMEVLIPLGKESEISTVAIETLNELEELVSNFCRDILAILKWGGAKEFLCEKVEKLYSDTLGMIQELANFWQEHNGHAISKSILSKVT